MDRAAIARTTLSACQSGQYNTPAGQTVLFKPLVDRCLSATLLYTPEELDTLRLQVLQQPSVISAMTLTVANETTLTASARLAQQYQQVGVLNFASARNPGGGFLKGASAQEESIARSSALYLSLTLHPDFYEQHRHSTSLLYSDSMIFSPYCPVIRDDAGNWLDAPYTMSIITSPAPNAGAISTKSPAELPFIESTVRRRAAKILALAASHGCDALILGAWGCGVFGNDPAMVALIFADLLTGNGPFVRRFGHVHFAVYTSSREQLIYQTFAQQFADKAH